MNTVTTNQFIVAGIGTEIGKTLVSAVLVERLRADYWKPIQSGGLTDSDTDTVRHLITNDTSRFHPEAYRLTEPLSPHAAAAIDGITIELARITLPQTDNALVVELAGGLLVPLNDQDLTIDMVQRLNLPVVLVSKNYLGSINHTLLSVEACRSRGIPLLGIIFNGPTVRATEEFILNHTKLPCLARISQLDTVNPDVIKQVAATLPDVFWYRVNRYAVPPWYGVTFDPIPELPATQQASLPQRDQAVVWHPFTQMQTAPLPIPIARGAGSVLYDADGNEYIDAISSWWVNLHGHAHPYIADRVAAQLNTLEHVIFAGFTHQPAVELAERLLAILPQNQAKVFYSDNGSTAVEVALKMAFQYWHNLGMPRRKVIAFQDAYHGDTFGAMAVSGRSAFTGAFVPFLFDVEYLPTPVAGREADVLALAETLFTDEVAAFIAEPLVQGAGGMVMYEPAVLDQLIRLARRSGALVIADEVMTGFGRTGRLFASHHLQEPPDLMCLSKGLTGGTMALGVTTCTSAIYDAFLSDDKFKTLFHGHSFTANPLACTAALASMDLLLSDETQANIRRIAARHAEFADRLRLNSAVSAVRQRGTLLAFDLVVSGGTSYFSTIRDRAYNFLLNRGVLMRPLGNVLYLMPPYCTTDAQLTTVYGHIDALLTELQGKPTDNEIVIGH
ncbi:MAG: adenosylmethionine--8-amino-7-oxononanoate transaminase [Bacteroidetes bacterium]|nr:adenosylmethionine--8-amino-7-oxononanoate transaminase [Fibrella sp.]